jgi:PleD family two-component response regulator
MLANRERLIETLGQQVALTLANIRLRARLREQSLRDPLTGLFNRRYMAESLDREIRRAGAVRGEDVPCRFGGEEFMVLLPKASLADTLRRAEALREGIKVHPLDAPTRLYPTLTMSVGVAAYPEHGASVEELILAADSAMYRAKMLGRDRVVVAGGHEGRPIEVSAG